MVRHNVYKAVIGLMPELLWTKKLFMILVCVYHIIASICVCFLQILQGQRALCVGVRVHLEIAIM